MDNMSSKQAVAIRFSELKHPDLSLCGMTPVAVVTHQALDDVHLSGDFHYNFSSPGKHPVDEICFVMDRSSSMAAKVGGEVDESRFDNLRRELSGLPWNLIPDETIISGVWFAQGAVKLKNLSKGNFQNQLELVGMSHGTNFAAAFSAAIDTFTTDIRSRKVLAFFTDGLDRGSRRTVSALLDKLKNLNTAAFVVGIGSSQDRLELAQMSGKLGFSHCVHSPIGRDESPLHKYLPDFLGNIANCDEYLTVTARGKTQELWSATPDARPMPADNLTLGYLQHGVGICFFGDLHGAELTLKSGNYAADPDASVNPIKIVDADNASFADLKSGKEALEQVLMTRAILTGDVRELDALASEFEPLSDDIARLRKDAASGLVDNARRRIHRLIKGVCTGINRDSPAHSDLGDKVELPAAGSELGSRSSRMSNLGENLDLGPGDHPKLLLSDDAGQPILEYSMNLWNGEAFKIGRGRHCDLSLPVQFWSRLHCTITRREDKFYLADHSKNGTRLNGRSLPTLTEVVLRNGDIIDLTSVQVQIYLPKK